MVKISVSDSIAKLQVAKFLLNLGFTNVSKPKGLSCDLIALKNNQEFFIEVKYSTRTERSQFFGTVMFTELNHAINNKNNYLFVVCRGQPTNLDKWFYKIYNLEEFLKFCTLTTPIAHYRIKLNETGELEKAQGGKNTVHLNEEMISDIWKKYREWKPKND